MMPDREIRACAFRVGQRGKTWYVTRDGAFYGDYNSQAQAVAAASFGARAAEAQGASASVVDGTNETVIPHRKPPGRS